MTHATILNNISDNVITFGQATLKASNWLGKNIILVSGKGFEIAKKVAAFIKPLFIEMTNFLKDNQETAATVLGAAVICAGIYLLFDQLLCSSNHQRERQG